MTIAQDITASFRPGSLINDAGHYMGEESSEAGAHFEQYNTHNRTIFSDGSWVDMYYSGEWRIGQ